MKTGGDKIILKKTNLKKKTRKGKKPALEAVLLTWEKILQNASGHAEKQKALLEQRGWSSPTLYSFPTRKSMVLIWQFLIHNIFIKCDCSDQNHTPKRSLKAPILPKLISLRIRSLASKHLPQYFQSYFKLKKEIKTSMGRGEENPKN